TERGVLYKCRTHDSEISGDRVYGYLVLESDLMEYAKFIGADQGNDDDDISLAAAHLLVRANLGKGKLTGATHPISGKFYNCCLAIARVTPDPRECIPMPDRERVAKLREILGIDEDPRWYKWM
ncbi:hypothetical protein H0H93_013619, partial [Arthromyces matolae]